MIPVADVTAWAIDRPWVTQEQVEQDLLLSRAICEIARHPYLGEELAFRGGTAFHKLHLAQPLRYSEDLDYVRPTSGGISELTRALTEVAESLGYAVSTRVSAQGFTAPLASTNLRRKLDRTDFRHDLDPLVRSLPDGYDIDEAGALVITELLEKIR